MKDIYFFYPKGEKITGQEMASTLIFENLADDFNFHLYKQPVFSSSKNKVLFFPVYCLRVLLYWLKVFFLIFKKPSIIYLNIGQTLPVLIRDGLPIIFLMFFKPTSRLIVSIHNNRFMSFNKTEHARRIFFDLLKKSSLITVLGQKQQSFLLSQNIAEDKIKIVNNTCSLEPLTKKVISNGITILYLSNFLPDKGYIEFLEAIKELNLNNIKHKIKVYYCGDFYISEKSQISFLDKHISEINEKSGISITWLKGAYGDDKKRIFSESDIFVLPSKNEAQPIVLIEAMASACALISSKVGEIETMLDERNALFLDEVSVSEISKKLELLLQDISRIEDMQNYSLEQFHKKFSISRYKGCWSKIFERV